MTGPLLAVGIYVALIAVFLFWVVPRFAKSSYDPGPKPDEPDYPFFDKHSLLHVAGCAAACLFALWLGVPWWAALVLTIMGGAGYEEVNGTLAHRGSWYDVLWDALGAVLAVGLFGSVLQAQAGYTDTATAPLIDSARTGSGNAPLFMVGLGVVVLIAIVVLVALDHKKHQDEPQAGDVRRPE